MDKFGIEHIILSLTSPGPQGKIDKQEAEDLARRANDVSMSRDASEGSWTLYSQSYI